LPPDMRAPEDQAVAMLGTKEGWKRCPACRMMVQKVWGCNSMRCRCGKRFCYGCGQSPCTCYIYTGPRQNAVDDNTGLILVLVFLGILTFLMLFLWWLIVHEHHG